MFFNDVNPIWSFQPPSWLICWLLLWLNQILHCIRRSGWVFSFNRSAFFMMLGLLFFTDSKLYIIYTDLTAMQIIRKVCKWKNTCTTHRRNDRHEKHAHGRCWSDVANPVLDANHAPQACRIISWDIFTFLTTHHAFHMLLLSILSLIHQVYPGDRTRYRYIRRNAFLDTTLATNYQLFWLGQCVHNERMTAFIFWKCDSCRKLWRSADRGFWWSWTRDPFARYVTRPIPQMLLYRTPTFPSAITKNEFYSCRNLETKTGHFPEMDYPDR